MLMKTQFRVVALMLVTALPTFGATKDDGGENLNHVLGATEGGKNFSQRSQRERTETTERFRDILRALRDQPVR
jgi:hypothetical protein